MAHLASYEHLLVEVLSGFYGHKREHSAQIAAFGDQLAR